MNTGFSPLIIISPLSGVYIPYIILTKVDLPAPFSPRRASISPRYISSDTLSNATTPGNLLVIPLKEINGFTLSYESLDEYEKFYCS